MYFVQKGKSYPDSIQSSSLSTLSYLLFGIPQKKEVAKLICEQLRKSKNRTFRWSRRCQIQYIRNNKTTKTLGDGNIVNIEDETSTSTSAATKLL